MLTVTAHVMAWHGTETPCGLIVRQDCAHWCNGSIQHRHIVATMVFDGHLCDWIGRGEGWGGVGWERAGNGSPADDDIAVLTYGAVKHRPAPRRQQWRRPPPRRTLSVYGIRTSRPSAGVYRQARRLSDVCRGL